jgi:hypothetical protein
MSSLFQGMPPPSDRRPARVEHKRVEMRVHPVVVGVDDTDRVAGHLGEHRGDLAKVSRLGPVIGYALFS